MSDNNIKETVSEAIKERLHNRVYAYILTSVIAANWQHILIILKSKRDINSILTDITATNSFELYYFITPTFCGIVLALTMPFLTKYVEIFTAKQYVLIKNSQLIGEENFKLDIERRRKKTSEINLKTVINEKEASTIIYQTELLKSQSTSYYNWLRGLLTSYNKIGGKIENEQDLKRLLFELENNNSVFDEAILPEFKKMMHELKAVHEKQNNH